MKKDLNLSDDTSLNDLMLAGARTLGDIPLTKLLEYVQKVTTELVADVFSDAKLNEQ